ncbi:MAG: hypothetical protein ACFFD4_06430 [Candidatus Odinarchaeota archaeon]
MFVLDITLVNWMYIGICVLVFIPLYFLIKYYSKTRVFDYLLLGGVFFATIVNKLGVVMQYYLGTTLVNWLFWQFVIDIAYILICFQVFIFAMRIKWSKIPRIIWNLVILWIFNVSFFVFFYYTFTITISEKMVLFIMFIKELNRVLAMSFALYVYLTTPPLIQDRRVLTARKLWIISIGLFIVYGIIHVYGITTIGNSTVYMETFFLRSWLSQLSVITNLSGFIIIGYTTIQYPEAVIFSKSHVIRAMDVYKSVISLKREDSIREYGVQSIVDYLKRIPPELVVERH